MRLCCRVFVYEQLAAGKYFAPPQFPRFAPAAVRIRKRERRKKAEKEIVYQKHSAEAFSEDAFNPSAWVRAAGIAARRAKFISRQLLRQTAAHLKYHY